MSFKSNISFLSLTITLLASSLGFSHYQLNGSLYQAIDDVGIVGRVDNGIPNFQKTTDSIFRGGRPSEQGLQFLKKAGFKTIINIENNSKAIKNEMAIAKRLGLLMYSSPMSWQTTPDDKQVNTILAALQNPQMYPIFIHCHYGKDRTGLIIGLYRVFVQKWNPKDAYSEMLKYGYHPEYKALDNYYRAKTKMR